MKTTKKLHMHIRKLDDGRYKIGYWWHWWENEHIEYLGNLDDLKAFVSKMIANTNF